MSDNDPKARRAKPSEKAKSSSTRVEVGFSGATNTPSPGADKVGFFSVPPDSGGLLGGLNPQQPAGTSESALPPSKDSGWWDFGTVVPKMNPEELENIWLWNKLESERNSAFEDVRAATLASSHLLQKALDEGNIQVALQQKNALQVFNNTLDQIWNNFYKKAGSFLELEHFKLRFNKIKFEYRDKVLEISNIIQGSLNIFERFIEEKLQLSDDFRFELIEEFARAHGGVGVAAYARKLFGSVKTTSAPLPNLAPELYGGLRGPETPPDFVNRVYGEWLGKGLTRAHIRQLDPKLSMAISNWLKRPGNEWPADVDLPTRSERVNREIENLREAAPQGNVREVLGDYTAREAGRIRSAIQRRDK